ncbi:MAG TPA: saccharopine dehydrogenase NADP-binding domain-containing protein [Geobacterales bacterium]|nr:saccharopine dehydrogenase NADP-binding domain-containing protein [Geobacterales bacterium]
MKLLILGGAGDMGSNIVRFASQSTHIAEVHIGDIDRIKGETLAKEIGDKCKFIYIDARKREEFVNMLKNYDLVASALGPFYEFGPIVAKACIEAGVSLFDICDDYDAAKNILDMNEQAKTKGITIMTGIGWTPGLSNILAKYAYESLDGVSKIRIFWVGSAADSKGLAVIMHLLYAITGNVPMYRDGKEEWVKAGNGKEEVIYPSPVNKAYAYYTGHPEPVTLPKYLPGLKDVEVKGGLIPDWQNGLGKFFVSMHLTNTPSRRRRLSKFLHRIENVFRSGGIECSAVRVDAYTGDRKISLAAADRMGRLTAMPIACACELFAMGKINERGCFAPEGLLETKEILASLTSKGINIYKEENGQWKALNI